MQLSKNFWLREFTQSQTALRRNIDNTPGPIEIENLNRLCDFVLQPVRNYFGRSVVINSGYRSPALNRAIGGAKKSQHVLGQAADIEIPGIPNKDVAVWIRDNLNFDQLILEFYDPTEGPASGWVHVSYVSDSANRKQVLTINKKGTFSGLL